MKKWDRWSANDISLLYKLNCEGVSDEEIAQKLERTIRSVRAKRERLKIDKDVERCINSANALCPFFSYYGVKHINCLTDNMHISIAISFAKDDGTFEDFAHSFCQNNYEACDIYQMLCTFDDN